ncbi:MAG: PAS domain-containing sensor histidine kinase, partial [Terrimicrobiaceae bacterium]
WSTISSGGTWRGRLQNRRKDGSLYWESATIFPLCGGEGKILHFIAIKENITAEMGFGDMARKARKEADLLAEQSGTVYWQVDADGLYTEVSPACSKVWGYRPEELIGRRHFYDLHPPEVREQIKAKAFDVFKKQQPFVNFPNQLTKGDGRKIWVLTNGVPFLNGAGQLAGYSGTDMDITELKQTEEALRAEILRRKELEQEVMAIAESEQRRIGHDLHDGICQELSGIQYVAELVAKRLPEELPEKKLLAKTAADIRKVILHTRHLSHSLAPVALEKGDLSTALAELATNTETSFGISCGFSCPSPPEISSSSTASHLYRIAQESVQNAIRHGKATTIKMTLLPLGTNWVLQVADNGTSTRPGEKSGRGLHIMHYRASMFGGTLHFRKNAGTTMTCTFSP